MSRSLLCPITPHGLSAAAALVAWLVVTWLVVAPQSTMAKNDKFDLDDLYEPVTAALVADTDTYVLAPEQRGEAFRKKLADAKDNANNAGQAQIIMGNNKVQAQRIIIKAQPLPARAVPRPKKLAPAKLLPKKQAKPAGNEKATEDDPADTKNDDEAETSDEEPGDAETVGEEEGPENEADEERDEEGDKADEKPKAEAQQKIQVFQFQGGQGGIQIQGRIQIQVQGGAGQPQVQILGGPGGTLPSPPAVNLAIEVKNNTTDPIMLQPAREDGSAAYFDLTLDGPGAVTIDRTDVEKQPIKLQALRPGIARAAAQAGVTVGGAQADAIEIAPGRTHQIPIRQLRHGKDGGKTSYWTEPGEYTISATYFGAYKIEGDETLHEVTLKTGRATVTVVAEDEQGEPSDGE